MGRDIDNGDIGHDEIRRGYRSRKRVTAVCWLGNSEELCPVLLIAVDDIAGDSPPKLYLADSCWLKSTDVYLDSDDILQPIG
jgi:hypothetical protein